MFLASQTLDAAGVKQPIPPVSQKAARKSERLGVSLQRQQTTDSVSVAKYCDKR